MSIEFLVSLKCKQDAINMHIHQMPIRNEKPPSLIKNHVVQQLSCCTQKLTSVICRGRILPACLCFAPVR